MSDVAEVIGVSKSAVHRAGVPNGTANDENANEANGAEDETVPNGTPAAPVLEEPPREIMPPALAAATVPAEPALPTEAMPSQPAAPSADAPALPEIEYPIGSTRQAILDHFLDTEGDQTMAQIKAALPTVLPTTVEASVRREWEAGRLLRVSPGTYRLAPAKPAEQPKSPKPPPPQPEEEAVWFDALERWAADPSSWDVEKLGPPPNQPNNIPVDIKARFNDRQRKRAERRREAEAAAAKRTAADAELRDRLIAATGGNIVRGPAIDDVSPIQLAMQLVPLERILSAIRNTTNRKMFPKNEPATSWREQRLLLEIAESYCRTDIVPRLVDAWSKAGKGPGPTVPISPPASDTPDDIIDRSRHDAEHAPAGPHSLAQLDATQDMSHEPAPSDRSENAQSIETTTSSAPQNAGGVNRTHSLDLSAGQVPEGAAAPVAEGRASVLAAFARNRTSPQPAAPQPAPPPHRPPERRVERQAQTASLSDEAVDELIAGWRCGNLAWPRRLLGGEPGNPDCRLSRETLRRNGLA
jgi:hypothetical protein